MESQPSIRILVVEDYAPNRKIVELQLRGFPVVLDEADNGVQAVAKAVGARYDLILMDLDMPVMDGLEATRRIRDHERASCLAPAVIVALTSHDTEQDKRESLAAGCDAFVSKPVTRASVVELLAGLRVSPAAAPVDCIDPLLADLVPQFLTITRTEAGIMRQALERGDMDALARHGHSLKGAAANYGFPELGGLGKRIEDAARGTLPGTDIGPLIDAVLARLDAIAAMAAGK